ncbi:YfcE family phosphodiesterase [Sulfurimonas sp.]|uniref:YfcE family phosphodiesterase n=1 Tax=Sulfurimonas sp. TaxID=2022749 RepID=UPI002B481B56|nr:YfcE family phosphodiesterase [Sulfurimonas sp.]
MKIGIISDTHSKVKMAQDALNLLIDNGAEFIIHAGDIVELDTLNLLKNCGLKYIAVYGNNDAHLAQYHSKYNLVQEPHMFKLADTKFKLMHMPYYMSPDADVVVFGHTHQFEVDYKGNALFINSGEVCARSKNISECAMLKITDATFEVIHYTKKTKTKKDEKFKQQTFSYKRNNHE